MWLLAFVAGYIGAIGLALFIMASILVKEVFYFLLVAFVVGGIGGYIDHRIKHPKA